MPINRTTLNLLYDLDLADRRRCRGVSSPQRAEPVDPIVTSADVVISKVGRELYETFFRGYTRKQWGMDPSDLDKSVTARVPTRTNTDDRYFSDIFQAMPADGYSRMFELCSIIPISRSRLVSILPTCTTRSASIASSSPAPSTNISTFATDGCPIVPLRFITRRSTKPFQPVAVVNYPDERIPTHADHRI
jgi:UDP-galactopyranose mutase